jgi:hypothetical protein
MVFVLCVLCIAMSAYQPRCGAPLSSGSGILVLGLLVVAELLQVAVCRMCAPSLVLPCKPCSTTRCSSTPANEWGHRVRKLAPNGLTSADSQASDRPALCQRMRGGITVKKMANLGDVEDLPQKARDYLEKAIEGGLSEDHWTSGFVPAHSCRASTLANVDDCPADMLWMLAPCA